ncbi:Uncharacterised protein [Mycoplasmopsis arginini]|nr:Uncharacterised protein [Chlamydia abortus]SGA16723.1 Uncharacterised protein [Mycoplasmopsis arginini]SGA21706.1 Uncharacterised protein [Mycoplasmopsis arginini]SGA32870.1 Uncharacterised protein [Chlamydia abortus]
MCLTNNSNGNDKKARPTAGITLYGQSSIPDDTKNEAIAIAKGTKKMNELGPKTLNLNTNSDTTAVCKITIKNAIGNKVSHLPKFFVLLNAQPSLPSKINNTKEGMAIRNKPVRAILHELESVFLSFLISKVW